MNSFEENMHTFIVRIWLEPRELAGAKAEWRGMVEHVFSGERRYVKALDEITTFLVPYMEKMGIKPP